MLFGPTSSPMNCEMILISSRGSIAHCFGLSSSVQGTVNAMFICCSFCTFLAVYCTEYVSIWSTISFQPNELVIQVFWIFVWFLPQAQIKSRQHKCHKWQKCLNFTVLDNHEMTCIKALCSTTSHQKSSLQIVPNTCTAVITEHLLSFQFQV